MKNIVDFTDKHILVVGASSGIGRETSITLNKLGARLDIVARDEQKLLDTLSEMDGNDNHYLVLDVQEVDKIDNAVKNLVELYGPYDGVVYSAGVSWGIPVSMFNPEKLSSIFDVNFFGFYEMVRQITKRKRYNEGMRIVGISSIAALKGSKAQSGYSASKAAMDGAVRSMAVELASKNICINTVAFGMIDTNLFAGYKENFGTDSFNYELLMDRQVLGIGETQDAANAIAFLLSPAAKFITGQCMVVDGGYTA